jgi:hypothetical protein
MPGIPSAPTFVTLRHWAGWVSADIVISSLKGVRCVLSNL